MRLIRKINQINRLHSLIKRKSTGSPKELAAKFNVSERCIYRLMDELKHMDIDINYNRSRRSYEYITPIESNLLILIDNQKME